jgi:hypothetical protein
MLKGFIEIGGGKVRKRTYMLALYFLRSPTVDIMPVPEYT